MFERPSVLITAMVLGFLLAVVVVGSVVVLAWNDKDSNVINTLITAGGVALGGMLGARWRAKGIRDDA